MNVRLAGSFGASFISRTRTPSVLRIFGECRRHNGSISPRRTWTQQDIDELFKLREEGKDIRSIASLIGRTPNSVSWRLKQGARPASQQNFWTEEDTKVLHDMRAEGQTNASIAVALGRSLRSITSKLERDARYRAPAPTLGQLWTKDEIAYLRRMRVQGLPTSEIATALGRSIRGTESAAWKYRSSDPTDSSDWSQEERELLYRLKEAGLSWRQIAEQFPNRSIRVLQSCYERRPPTAAIRGKKTQWSPDELQTLHTLRGEGVTVHEIAERLHRSPVSISTRLWRTAVKRNPASRRWTSEDIKRLVALKSQSKPWAEIAAVLGRTWEACRIMYQRLSDEQREELSKS